MGFEQASALLTALYSQVTGSADASTPVDTSSFISMAQATLRSGYEPVMSAISQVLGRTLIAVRPYSRKFKGLEMTADRWGGITRKINFIDNALDSADPTFALVEGQPVDQFVVKKPKVLETHYYGQNVYESSYTIFTKQLDTAFSSPAEFASFMSGLMTHFSNEREQYLESLSRSILCNLIGAKKVLADASVANQVIDLLAEYNTATGQSLTATTVKLPANYPAFCKWAYAYIQHVSEMFTERTGMFQRPLTNYAIMRHTPKADQRLFMDADFLAHMTAEVLADTYHDNFLRYSEVEAVNYWQSALEPDAVNVKPVYLNASAEYVNAESAVEVDNVVGVLMDRDAAGYNLADDDLVSSPYNAKGQYYTLFNHVRIQLQNDLTEKAVVFCIGEGGGPEPEPGETYPKFVINGTMAGAPPVITWGDSTCSMTYAELLEYLDGISGDNRAAIVEENLTDPGGTTSTTIYGATIGMENYSSGNPIYVNWSNSRVYIEVASDGTISVEDVESP